MLRARRIEKGRDRNYAKLTVGMLYRLGMKCLDLLYWDSDGLLYFIVPEE